MGELAHTGRLHLGTCIAEGKNNCARKISPVEVRRLVRNVASRLGGGATAFLARGIYRQQRPEPTAVIETIVGVGVSCETFTSKLKRLGAELARRGRQDSVLVVTECAGRAKDAEFVGARGDVRGGLARRVR